MPRRATRTDSANSFGQDPRDHIVRSLIRENEQLSEDIRQLYAAVGIYREIIDQLEKQQTPPLVQ